MARQHDVSATIHGVKSVRFTLAAVAVATLGLLNRDRIGDAWSDVNDPNDLIVYMAILDALNGALPPAERMTVEMLEGILNATPAQATPRTEPALVAMVLRADDNGLVRIVEDEMTVADATALHDLLAARGHKQTYSIETYPPGGSEAVRMNRGAVR